MAKKTKGKGKDDKIKRFLKNLPIMPCLRKHEPMLCSVCKEKNLEVAQHCPHVASEIYGATPIHKEASAKKPGEEEVVKFKPIPKTLLGTKPKKPKPLAPKAEKERIKFKLTPKLASLYKPKKPLSAIFKRKEKRKPKVLPKKRYVLKLEEGFFTKKFKMVAGIIIVIAIILQSISILSMSEAEDIKISEFHNSLDWNFYSVQKENAGYTFNTLSAEAEGNLEFFNNTKLTDFLTDRGLDDFFGVAENRFRRYYVFTDYNQHSCIDEDGLVGTELLAQDYGLGLIGSYGSLLTTEWNSVDVDGDGDDIKVRINPNTTGMPYKGGMDIEIQRINDKSPIGVYFVKPSSYDNKTYVWVVGFHFSNLPNKFKFTAVSEEIIEVTGGGMAGNYVETINPPYVVDWCMDEDVAEFKTIIGYANITRRTEYREDTLPFVSEDDTSEPTTESWTHDTDEDFEENCDSENNVIFTNVTNGEIMLDNKWLDGEYISKPHYVGENAILKSVIRDTDTPLRTSVWVKGSENSVWIPATASITEVVQGESFQYKIELKPGGDTNLKKITLTVAKGGTRVDTSGGELKLATFTFTTPLGYVDIYYPQGTFVSSAYNLGRIVKFEDVKIKYHFEDNEGNDAYPLLGATIELFLNTSVDNTNWSGFIPVWSSATSASNTSHPLGVLGGGYGRYVQYKLMFTGLPMRTPVVTEIRLGYSMKFGNFAEKCWVSVTLSPAPKGLHLYYEDTDTMQTLTWESTRKTNLSCLYVSSEKLYTKISIENTPTSLSILTKDLGTNSSVTYTANDATPQITYSCYQPDINRKTYFVLENIPTSFAVVAPFKLPPETQNRIEPKENLITTVLDYVVMQATAPFSRFESMIRDPIPDLTLTETYQCVNFSASNDLGRVYLSVENETSTAELFLSEINSQTTVSVEISSNNIILKYTSTDTIDYLFFNITKINNNPHSINVLIHKIPKSVNLEIRGVSNLQQENYKINKIKIYAENAGDVTVKFNRLFGKLPMIELKSDGIIRVNIDHEFKLFGDSVKKKVVLSNIAIFSVKIQENSFAITDSNTHYIIPAPMLTLDTWNFAIVILIGIVGAAIALSRKMRKTLLLPATPPDSPSQPYAPPPTIEVKSTPTPVAPEVGKKVVEPSPPPKEKITPSPPWKCQKCGFLLDEDSDFCPNCGTKVR